MHQKRKAIIGIVCTNNHWNNHRHKFPMKFPLSKRKTLVTYYFLCSTFFSPRFKYLMSACVMSLCRGSSPRRFRQPAPRSPLRYDTPRQNQQSNNDPNQLTPSLQSSPLAGKNLESELESVKAGADDDDTPDFIKYGDEMGSPTRTTVTNSGSPKQKRVTPPRYGGNREQGSSRIGCGNSHSPGLRNSRKFILQALPSLPPVTPPFSNG